MTTETTTIRPTGKTIAAWYDRIVPGHILTCLANEVWNPEKAATALIGQRFEYVSGKNEIKLHRLCDQKNFWTSRPKRVSDVVSLTDREITYRIRDHKTCTWRYDGAPIAAAEAVGSEGERDE